MVKATRYYEMLREKFPDKEKHPADFQKFIKRRMVEYIGRMDATRCRNLLQGLLWQHYYFLGAGEDEKATGLYEHARAVDSYWQTTHTGETQRLTVDFEQIRGAVLLNIFAGQASFPPLIFEGLRSRFSPALLRQLDEGARRMMEQREGHGAPE